MKKSIFTISMASFIALLFFMFTMPLTEKGTENVNKAEKFKIPDDIQPIIKKSCFGCHNTTSKNDKAKAKLTFDTLEKMKKREIAGILGKIKEEVNKGDMPPPKFLERFVNAKPTDEEKQKLISWTDSESGKMMKKEKSKEKSM